MNRDAKSNEQIFDPTQPYTAEGTLPLPWPGLKSQRRAPSRATAAPQREQWSICGKCHLAVGGSNVVKGLYSVVARRTLIVNSFCV